MTPYVHISMILYCSLCLPLHALVDLEVMDTAVSISHYQLDVVTLSFTAAPVISIIDLHSSHSCFSLQRVWMRVPVHMSLPPCPR